MFDCGLFLLPCFVLLGFGWLTFLGLPGGFVLLFWCILLILLCFCGLLSGLWVYLALA